MYSKWIMVSVLMTTNLFTLYLQDLNPCMHMPVPVFGCLQNLIVNFKDHDYTTTPKQCYHLHPLGRTSSKRSVFTKTASRCEQKTETERKICVSNEHVLV